MEVPEIIVVQYNISDNNCFTYCTVYKFLYSLKISTRTSLFYELK